MDYTQYNVEDLAADESFVAWAHRSDPEAVRFWEAFMEQHPEMVVRIHQARVLVLNLKNVQEKRFSEHYINTLWARIEEEIPPVPQKPKKSRLAWAVVPLVLAGLAVFLYTSFNITSLAEDTFALTDIIDDGMVEEVNLSEGPLRVFLADGSTVILEPNSRLRYSKKFVEGASREVFLSGVAFFDVARNPAQPFLVHTDDVVTRVLGTSFRVEAPANGSEVIVAVKTGRVSVYSRKADPAHQSSSGAVILAANQQVTYRREDDAFGKSLVPEPEIVKPAIRVNQFNFENTAISEVFRVLEEAYGVEIIFDEEVMANCFVTAPLGSESLFEKLRIICRAIGARYETIDASVVITSTGC